ncbi:MAG: hypothetical protein PHQ58_20165 [Rhodoferax sp.]|uniref:hypothetical protein n=1 Tax=Rhodoferax sp. TaxID=50421 RepID=UPI00262BFEFF|nr:hypothetical protein [Rhodoferax sp.]MDD2882740.1 hypothetical protein [Rhodoferax sp.]
MNNTPRPPPRFVPTLTEVVDPASLSRLAPNPQPDVQAVINLVQRQIQPIFERRLQEELDRLIRTMVAKQWSDLSARLQDEMDMFVRQAVADALSEQSIGKTQK